MAGWSKEKRRVVEAAFREFLCSVTINSKDTGPIVLGENLYDAQERFITAAFDALEEDIHWLNVLKSRQLGISTVTRAFSVFFNGIHDGLSGAVVFDTDANKNTARREMENMVNDLPKGYKFPRIKLNNRQGLTLDNSSTLMFMSAGVRQTKSGGTLGRSVGLSFAHMSEICSYDNDEGLEAFENSLSELNPDRFYVRESTARGFNKWHELWQEARSNSTMHKCIFLGWWSKPSQKITRDHPDFERYGTQAPTDREMKKIQEVFDLYGHNITFEQLAWIRRKMDPAAKQEGDAPNEYEGTISRLQEQPWTEADAFQMTGSVFFAPEKLTEMVQKHVSKKFTTWMYSTGIEFTDCRIYKAANARSIELKVWEEPDEEGIYVVSVDPAFGFNKTNDRSAIQVIRCYADGCDQVAEYAWPLINTRQLAWVVASLLGWYAGQKAQVYLILEMNGPGDAVWAELQSLKHQVQHGYQPQQVEDSGLKNIFRNIKNYVYMRADSIGSNMKMQITTTPRLKVTVMERLKDFVTNGMLHIRSMDTLEEMRSITRDGDSIKAQGSKKDDRVMALAMAVRCWEERIRKGMASMRRTREGEMSRKTMSIRDQASLFSSNQLGSFFAQKQVARVKTAQLARRSSWRHTR